MELEQSKPSSSITAARRQALNACDACRSRKTKCDESKPSCGRCARLGLACSYVETVTSKRNLSLVELTSTLTRMERKIDSLVTQDDRRSRQPATASVPLNPTGSSDGPSNATSPAIPMENYFAPSNFDSPQNRGELAMSERHSTAPQHLLSWPCSTTKLSKLELNYPLALEVKTTRLPRTTGPPSFLASVRDDEWLAHLSLHQVRQLTGLYFTHFHPPYLVIDESRFYSHHLAAGLRDQFQYGMDSVLSLLVLALGAVAAYEMGDKQWAQAGAEDGAATVGLGLFNHACKIFEDVEGTDWASVQCLILKGVFYGSKLRTHDCWRSIHKACTTILILLPLQDVLDAHQCQLYWVAYLHESQLLAEFDFPPSGLGVYASNVPLPLVPDSSQDIHREYQFFFLAHIAMRRLLNRIHFHVFSRKDDEATSQLNNPAVYESDKLLYTSASVVSELDRQLEEWRACLPAPLQFPAYAMSHENHNVGPYGPRPTHERLKGHLIARYFAAKTIIHRTFVYRALHQSSSLPFTDGDKVGARVAVDSAILSVLHSGLMHEPMGLLLHPINTCRSFYSCGLQIAFISRSREVCDLIPTEVEQVIHRMKEVLALHAAPVSPTVAKDLEILETMI